MPNESMLVAIPEDQATKLYHHPAVYTPYQSYSTDEYMVYKGRLFQAAVDFVSTGDIEADILAGNLAPLGTGSGGAGTTSVLTDNGDGTYTHQNGAGATVIIDTRTASGVSADANNDLTLGSDSLPYVDVSAEETVTTLSIAANILTYTDEAGVATAIDLTPYIDDTNLARLVSGTLDAGTGILTVTRDDATTFTIDLSSLLAVTPADAIAPAADDAAGAVGTSTDYAREDHKHPAQAPSADAANMVEASATDGLHYFTLDAATIGVPTTGDFVLGYSNGVLTVFPA